MNDSWPHARTLQYRNTNSNCKTIWCRYSRSGSLNTWRIRRWNYHTCTSVRKKLSYLLPHAIGEVSRVRFSVSAFSEEEARSILGMALPRVKKGTVAFAFHSLLSIPPLPQLDSQRVFASSRNRSVSWIPEEEYSSVCRLTQELCFLRSWTIRHIIRPSLHRIFC